MVQAMTKHVMEKHPDVAKKMEKMHNETDNTSLDAGANLRKALPRRMCS